MMNRVIYYHWAEQLVVGECAVCNEYLYSLMCSDRLIHMCLSLNQLMYRLFCLFTTPGTLETQLILGTCLVNISIVRLEKFAGFKKTTLDKQCNHCVTKILMNAIVSTLEL